MGNKPRDPTALAPDGSPVPDQVHTLLVNKYGERIVGRNAQPGDAYAVPPPPYHYGGYVHPEGTDPNSEEAKRTEAAARKSLDWAILDLAQTPSGYNRLLFAYAEGVKLQHNPGKLEGEAIAINDQASNSIWFGSNGLARRLQLTAEHEIGHTEQERRGLIVSDWDTMASAVIGLRAQEASSYTDEAEHAVECEFITNPNHYKPMGVLDMYEQTRPAMAEAAKKAAPLLQAGDRDGFRQAVHIAFYTPGQLAPYDLQLINEFKRWMPIRPNVEKTDPEYNKHWNTVRVFMEDNRNSHETVAEKLPYLKTASYSLNAHHLSSFMSTEPVLTAHAELCNMVGVIARDTGHDPKCRHFFVTESEFADGQLMAQTGQNKRPADRLVNTVHVEIPTIVSQPVEPKRDNLAVMELRKELPPARHLDYQLRRA